MRRGQETFGAWVLAAMPGSIVQITQRSGVCRHTVERWAGLLCTDGLAHISKIATPKQGGWPAAVYSAGAGIDAVLKSKNLTQKQLYKRYWTKARADGRAATHLLKNKERRIRARAIAAGDPMVNALFGRLA
jgi:hypothetical protein